MIRTRPVFGKLERASPRGHLECLLRCRLQATSRVSGSVCRSGVGLGIGNFNRFSGNFDVPSLVMDFENRWTRAVVPNSSCMSQSRGSMKTSARPRLHPSPPGPGCLGGGIWASLSLKSFSGGFPAHTGLRSTGSGDVRVCTLTPHFG